jgi:hypothetical protein
VRGILNDLVENGFLIRSGRADETRYRLATDEELSDFGAALEGTSAESLAAHVWLQIYREGKTSHERLSRLVPVSSTALEEALAELLNDGRISSETRGGKRSYMADEVLIPIGESVGWEAAVVDHHRAVLNALAAKITAGHRSSTSSDEIGGTTLTFDLWPGHPKEQEVRKLLANARAAFIPLWDAVTEYNRAASREGEYQVHFYCGQYVVKEEQP